VVVRARTRERERRRRELTNTINATNPVLTTCVPTIAQQMEQRGGYTMENVSLHHSQAQPNGWLAEVADDSLPFSTIPPDRRCKLTVVEGSFV
jgi:hypothetical protein